MESAVGGGDPVQPPIHGAPGVETSTRPALRRREIHGPGGRGWCPRRSRIRRWSMRRTSSPCSRCGRRESARMGRRATTCSPGWCNAGCAVGGWTRTGSTAAPDTGAVTVTTARGPRPADAPRNVYVREDVLLDRLARQLVPDRHRSGGDVDPSTAAEIVARLRAESTVIVCGGVDWTLASAG